MTEDTAPDLDPKAPLARRLARGAAAVAVVASLSGLCLDARPLLLLGAVAAATLGAAASDRPRGHARAWLLVGWSLAAAAGGFWALGPHAAPASALAAAVCFAAALLDQRAWFGVLAGSAAIPAAIGAASGGPATWAAATFAGFSFAGLASVGANAAAAELPRAPAPDEERIARLAGGVAHDLNNALVAVIGSAELLVEELEEDAELSKVADDIRRAGLQANGVLRQLTAYSRRMAVHAAPVDLVQLARGLHPDARGGRVDGRVVGDAELLRAAVQSLIACARDLGGPVEVAVAAAERAPVGAPPGPYVEVTVRFDGPADARYLEPYWSPKRDGKGPGLGVAAAAGTARAHLGDLALDVRPGGGTFRLSLPAVPAAAPARVVWCGDDAAVRQIGAAALRAAGFEVTVARPDQVGADPGAWYVAAQGGPRAVGFDARTTHLAALVAALSARAAGGG